VGVGAWDWGKGAGGREQWVAGTTKRHMPASQVVTRAGGAGVVRAGRRGRGASAAGGGGACSAAVAGVRSA